jgi:TRAP-type C4-dicarboxylate transport system permease small subunit
MLNSLIDRYCKLISVLVALCLLVMVLMVFGNVVLRYGFNSGLAVSEELSRWLFVWMTFLGAVIALRDNAQLRHRHAGVEAGPAGQAHLHGLVAAADAVLPVAAVPWQL